MPFRGGRGGGHVRRHSGSRQQSGGAPASGQGGVVNCKTPPPRGSSSVPELSAMGGDAISYVMMSAVGCHVKLQTVDGKWRYGVLFTAINVADDGAPGLKVILRYCYEEGVSEPGFQRPVQTCIVDSDKVAQLVIEDVSLLSEGRAGVASDKFATDTQISGGYTGGERELVRWDDASVPMDALEDVNDGRRWDQFEANRRMFGVKTAFDESQYTTEIDSSHPDFIRKRATAERLAAQIERDQRIRGRDRADDSLGGDERFSDVVRQPSKRDKSRANEPPAGKWPRGETVGGRGPTAASQGGNRWGSGASLADKFKQSAEPARPEGGAVVDQTSTPEAVAPPSETAGLEAPALEEGSADDGTDAPKKKSLKDCVHAAEFTPSWAPATPVPVLAPQPEPQFVAPSFPVMQPPGMPGTYMVPNAQGQQFVPPGGYAFVPRPGPMPMMPPGYMAPVHPRSGPRFM